MGLFINKRKHPDVYETKGHIIEPNQGYSKTDYVSDLIKEQNKSFDLLHDRYEVLLKLLGQQKNTQANQWQRIGDRLEDLRESHLQHEEFEEYIMEWLAKLDDKNKQMEKFMETELILDEEFINQMETVTMTNNEIVTRLEKFETANDELVLKIEDQVNSQKQLTETVTKQAELQTEILNQLDNQEGMIEKIFIQLDYLRSVLFERTNYLVEKIENGYNLTSSYVYKLVKGSDKPLTLAKVNQKKDE